MGTSIERASTKRNGEAGINRFLLIARAAAVVVAGVTALFRIEPLSGPASIPVLLGALLLYNIAAGAAGYALGRGRSVRPWSLAVADIVVMSLMVGLTGAYNSAYFALLLFAMVEASVYFNWRTASAVIVTINGAQVVATAIGVATSGNSKSFYPLESRFLLLLVVGLLFVILAESMRREERARRAADRSSAQTANLNAIFSQMGSAHLNIPRLFETVFTAAESIGRVLFSAIVQRSAPNSDWTIAASSSTALCPIGRTLPGGQPPGRRAERASGPRTLTGGLLASFMPCAATTECRQLILCDMPAYSERDEGMLVVARSSGSPLDADDGRFLQALAIQAQLAIHNALLYNRQEQQLERLKSFHEMQDAFFTAAAHDLKTPLTVLGILSSTLRMTVADPSPEQEEMFATMEQNILRLQAHTDNLLAAARLEADDVVLRRSPIDSKRAALRSVEALQYILRDRGIGVDLKPETRWHPVVADPDRLGEVFGNLLSNAAKFAPSGSRITILHSCGGDRDVFSVCNQGPRVPDGERERIFEKAYTGKEAGARAGSGLGLYIVKKLVALHGGSVWVDTSPESVCFHFSLPHVDEQEAG